MKLDDVCDAFQSVGFPHADESAHPERDLILGARKHLETAVVDDEFLADCVTHELMRVGKNSLRQGRQGLVPFFTIPDLGIRFAFGYWAPGATPGPHEHTAWTISAVCRNSLEVTTYDRTESYRQRRLVPKSHFEAPAGKVGYVAEPCIHAPRNASRDSSLSLHVISPRDGERPDDHQAVELPGLYVPQPRAAFERSEPYRFVEGNRRRYHQIHLLARTVASMSVPRVPELLKSCLALGSPTTQKFVFRARPECARRETPDSDHVLVRSHPDLVLGARRVGDLVALVVETSDGPIEDFLVNQVAARAVAFAAKEATFSAAELPGDLSDEERTAIADALIESGLFVRNGGSKHG